ncbi:MAG: flagellar hook-basal body protein [Candidatus Glassbacteria bacterium]|nr:flagellar hook-basal body protein [Candidatus Glassbacteria bacterium]
MIKGLYTSAAGMLPLPYQQDLITNNLSNVNTAGYKQDRAFIRELVTADLYLNELQIASTGTPPPMVNIQPPAFRASVGNSSQVVQMRTEFTQGEMEVTGIDYNLAIEGDGFFTVQTPAGARYTRGGNFKMDPDGNLATVQGFQVLGTAGPLNVQGGDFKVLQNGDVYVDNVQVGALRISDFEKPYELNKVADNLFVPRAGATAQAARNFTVKQGMLEKANAHPVDQLVAMIEVERYFEFGQRAIRLQDETLQQAATQVGKI